MTEQLSPEFWERVKARIREDEERRNTPVPCARCGKVDGRPDVFGSYVCWECHDRSMREPMSI